MHKNATKCNETLSKWCKNKHGASKIIDMFETYHAPSLLWRVCQPQCSLSPAIQSTHFILHMACFASMRATSRALRALLVGRSPFGSHWSSFWADWFPERPPHCGQTGSQSTHGPGPGGMTESAISSRATSSRDPRMQNGIISSMSVNKEEDSACSAMHRWKSKKGAERILQPPALHLPLFLPPVGAQFELSSFWDPPPVPEQVNSAEISGGTEWAPSSSSSSSPSHATMTVSYHFPNLLVRVSSWYGLVDLDRVGDDLW
jgi:hypothetical protein